MCVAGRDSSCRERNNSRCRSWCFCFSGKSTISGFSISSSISPSYKETKLTIKNSTCIDSETTRMSCSKTFAKWYTLFRRSPPSSESSHFSQLNNQITSTDPLNYACGELHLFTARIKAFHVHRGHIAHQSGSHTDLVPGARLWRELLLETITTP